MENFVQERRGYFLLRFTEELIRNSKISEIYKLERILKEKGILDEGFVPKKSIPEKVKLKIEQEKKEPVLMQSDLKFPRQKVLRRKRMPVVPRRSLRVPRQQLPPHMNYLRPQPTGEQIDLGKINALLSDSNVKTIEATGENEKVLVSGQMGRKPTGITLSKEEIDAVIDKFSSSAKIPKSEGMFKVAYGNLVLTAMISDKVSSVFVIKKL